MDDLQLVSEPAREVYRCPGDRHPIDRAAHLGRLATFYPACRGCAHRTDIGELTPVQIRQWEEILRRGTRGPRFTSEGLEADSVNDLGAEVVGRFATAVAIALWRRHERSTGPPAVLIGADGHWTTAERLAAACRALQLAGCRAIEAGAVTTPSLATAARDSQADAAVWIGNASGRPHAVELRVWGPAGLPWSLPGGLEPVRKIFDGRVSRPKRRGGSLDRAGAARRYLEPLAPQFHALRPLRFVLDTTSQPLVRYLRTLASQAACEVLRPAVAEGSGVVAVDGEQSSFVGRRLLVLGRNVVAEQAHFGLWIDGAGESCRLVDERGRTVDGERLFELLAAYVVGQQTGATIVLEPRASNELHAALVRAGARIARGAATRQGMCEAIESAGATFGGGPSGMVWFGGSPPVADALLTASLLLTILSQSDRPVSEVLDAV